MLPLCIDSRQLKCNMILTLIIVFITFLVTFLYPYQELSYPCTPFTSIIIRIDGASAPQRLLHLDGEYICHFKTLTIFINVFADIVIALVLYPIYLASCLVDTPATTIGECHYPIIRFLGGKDEISILYSIVEPVFEVKILEGYDTAVCVFILASLTFFINYIQYLVLIFLEKKAYGDHDE